MRQKCYLTLATIRVWLISYKLRLSHMGSDVGQIFPTASLHRDHSISYALVCEKAFSHMGRNSRPGVQNLFGQILKSQNYKMFFKSPSSLISY